MPDKPCVGFQENTDALHTDVGLPADIAKSFLILYSAELEANSTGVNSSCSSFSLSKRRFLA